MTNISKYHSVKVISAVMGFIVLSELAVAQDMGKNDSVSVRTEKTDMPYKVKGRIIDAVTKKGFAGARVTTPNLNVSAMTDENGNYEIGLPDLSVALYVEAPGYSRQVVPVKGRNEVNVSLFTVSGHAYYDDGMSVSDGEAVVDGFTSGTLSMTDDMTSLLNGQLRAISHSGDPGSSSSFFIRGYNSVNLSAQPLFVVDGVIWQMQDQVASAVDNYYNNPLTLLDPSDIEKVTILKNGSAVWGAKGANGVVLIDTKRAREMATQIEANISMGFQTPFGSLPLMGAAAYRRYATDIMSGMDRNEVEGFQFTNDDPTRSFYRAVHNDTKWTDEINKTSFIQNYGISVAGGDDIALYRFSLGYAKNDGNIDGTSFNRLNVRFNSDIKLTEDFKIQTDISYAQTGRRTVFEGLDGMRSPYFLSLVKSPLYAPWQYNDNGTFSGRLTDVDELNIGNPLALTGEDVPELDKYRFNLNLRPSYQITDRLEVAALFGISYDKENENLFIPDYGVSNEPLYTDRGEIYETALNEVRNFMARQTSMSVDGYLAWQILKDWRHDLNARIGGRFYNTYYRYTMGQGYNTGSDYMTALSNTNSDLRTLTGYEYTDRNAAWYFNADYAFRHRYFFNVGMSLETSSRFGREAGGLDLCGVSWGYFCLRGLVGFIGKVHAECGFYQQSQSPCGLYDVGQR
jgi:TonB-dependent SusC/RagA subfamily outer membrane receptor